MNRYTQADLKTVLNILGRHWDWEVTSPSREQTSNNLPTALTGWSPLANPSWPGRIVLLYSGGTLAVQDPNELGSLSEVNRQFCTHLVLRSFARIQIVPVVFRAVDVPGLIHYLCR